MSARLEPFIRPDGVPASPRGAGAAGGSSFFWAMRLLPKPRRLGMFAVYAFCREVDDIADSLEPHARRLHELAAWRREIEALFRGQPVHPVARALAQPSRRFGLREADFLAVIEGMEMDAREDIRAPKLDMLDRYCDCVASAVGRLSVRVFGLDDGVGVPLAHSLGRALQLTNILRDLADDAMVGRLYLPAELLERHGVAPRDPALVLQDKGLPAVCGDLAAVAARHFADADRYLAGCPRRPARPALMMQAVYRRLHAKLVGSAWRDPYRRVSLSRSTKLWIALRHGVL